MKTKSRYSAYNIYKEWYEDEPQIARIQIMKNVLNNPLSDQESKDAAKVLLREWKHKK